MILQESTSRAELVLPYLLEIPPSAPAHQAFSFAGCCSQEGTGGHGRARPGQAPGDWEGIKELCWSRRLGENQFPRLPTP